MKNSAGPSSLSFFDPSARNPLKTRKSYNMYYAWRFYFRLGRNKPCETARIGKRRIIIWKLEMGGEKTVTERRN